MKEKNYWPHFIIALVIFALVLGIWTVKTAIDNPVELDNSYMMKYQKVDEKIYDLMKMKKEFEKKYQLIPITKKLSYPQTEFVFKIVDHKENPVNKAKVEVLFTRPDTTKYDIKKIAKYENGLYVVKTKLPLEGRWDIILKIDIDGLTCYYKFKYSTQHVIKLKKN